MPKNLTNKFFDINKLPKEEGMLVFGISMSRIGNRQDPAATFKDMQHLQKKIHKPGIGLTIVYSDTLYLYSDPNSTLDKKTFQVEIIKHKNGFLNLLKKEVMLIPQAFSFITWNSLLLNCRRYIEYSSQLKAIYKSNKLFQKYVKEDAERAGRKINQAQVDFLLEEILVMHLLSRGQFELHNDFVQHREKWVLFCYPGKPMASEIYIAQNNLLVLDTGERMYEKSFYDLEEKKLYDFDRIDLETIEL